MRAVLDHSNAVLIGSRSFRDEVVEHNGTDPDRFTIVPGATDTDRFAPDIDHELGSVGDPPTLLYHGRVDLRKGLGELIEAYEELRGSDELRLVVSGIGPDLDTLRQRAKDRGLDIDFLGYTDYDNAPKVYHRGDIFVSPTYSEGFSNTILEAMASGLPVVSTKSVGVVDCISDEHNGLLVDVQDSRSLAYGIRRMLSDEVLRRRLAENALYDVRTKYAWPVVAKQIREVYRAVAGQTPDPLWTEIYDPATTRETADLTCRYREQPHLL